MMRAFTAIAVCLDHPPRLRQKRLVAEDEWEVRAGTFQTDFQLLDAKGTFSGNCQVTGKTGDYARLHGTGSWTYFEEGGIRHYKCTARVHWD